MASTALRLSVEIGGAGEPSSDPGEGSLGRGGVNAETSAHTRNVLFTIEKALKAD